MAEKHDILYDILKELKQEHKELREDISEIKSILAENTSQLTVHMKRSDNLEKLWKHVEARVIKLEEPKKVMSFLYNKWIKLIAIVTGIVALVAALKDLF